VALGGDCGAEGAAAIGAFAWASGEVWGAAVAGLGAVGTAALLVPELKTGLRRTLKKLGAVTSRRNDAGAERADQRLARVEHSVHRRVPHVGAVDGLASISGERLKGLKDFAKGATVFEHHDVQFVVAAPESPTVAPGETVEVVVIAQNCVDADRKLLIEVLGDPQSVLAERGQTHSLLPGCVVRFVVPLRASAPGAESVHRHHRLLGVGDAAGPASAWRKARSGSLRPPPCGPTSLERSPSRPSALARSRSARTDRFGSKSTRTSRSSMCRGRPRSRRCTSRPTPT